MVSTGPTIPDLAFYILTGVLLFGGMAGIAYAFFGDRHRRMPLCRKCHYNMQGHTSLTCPECGYEHQRESELFKPQRHPKLAAMGLLVILLSAVVVYYPEVRYRQTQLHESAISAWLPTTFYILAWSSSSSTPAEVLERRDYAETSSERPFFFWQYALLYNQAERVTQDPHSTTWQLEAALGILEKWWWRHETASPPQGVVAIAMGTPPNTRPETRARALHTLTLNRQSQSPWAVDALIAALENGDEKIRGYAMNVIRLGEGDHAQTGEALARSLPAYDPTRRPHDVTDFENEVCETLIDIGPAVMPALTKALANEQTRGGAIYVIDQLAPHNAEAAAVLVRQYKLYEDDIAGPYIGHHAQVIGRMGEAATPAMVEALLDPDSWVRLSAIEALREIYKPDEDALWKQYAELRPDPRSDTAWTAINGLWELADRESDQTIRERAEFVARELTLWRQDVYRLTG